MLKKNHKKIIDQSKSLGWVLEPDAKALMKSQGFDIPDFILTNSFGAADVFLKDCKGPIVAKAVSKKYCIRRSIMLLLQGFFQVII
jgi:acetyl-CoA synthetase (ADP-forming)/acetyltransferase